MLSYIRSLSLTVACFAACVSSAGAGSATWNAAPSSNRWSNSENWTPATVPNAEDDVATFGASQVSTLILTAPRQTFTIDLGQLTFQPGASQYTLVIRPIVGAGSFLSFYGSGVINNSGLTQSLVAANSGAHVAESGRIYFENFSSAGDNLVITNQGCSSAEVMYGAFTAFEGRSSAGNATIINEGSTASETIYGGFTNLSDAASAQNATFISNPGTVSGAAAGHTLIQSVDPGNLGTSTFIANAATVPGAEGGWVEMDYGTCAGTRFIANGATTADCQGGQIYAYGAEAGTGLGLATYTAKGGNGAGAEGGLVDVLFVPANPEVIVKALGGKNGGLGGTIEIEDSADIPLPQFQVFGNGLLDLTNVSDKSMTLGSLAGDGLVNLAGHNLGIGNNDLDTIFSGVISGQGNLTKEGTGALSLNGINTYGGNTTVRAGTLGGKGAVKGKLIVADSATLAPAAGSNLPVTFTSKKDLTFQSGSSYECLIASKGTNTKSDRVTAKGITIESGAQCNLSTQLQGQLTTGTSFTILNNTASTAISGTFGNLADGATISVNGTTFQASYEGGDGNDLTLTVQ